MCGQEHKRSLTEYNAANWDTGSPSSSSFRLMSLASSTAASNSPRKVSAVSTYSSSCRIFPCCGRTCRQNELVGSSYKHECSNNGSVGIYAIVERFTLRGQFFFQGCTLRLIRYHYSAGSTSGLTFSSLSLALIYGTTECIHLAFDKSGR